MGILINQAVFFGVTHNHFFHHHTLFKSGFYKAIYCRWNPRFFVKHRPTVDESCWLKDYLSLVPHIDPNKENDYCWLSMDCILHHIYILWLLLIIINNYYFYYYYIIYICHFSCAIYNPIYIHTRIYHIYHLSCASRSSVSVMAGRAQISELTVVFCVLEGTIRF